jgi:tricarballylate dehydrogenase
MRARQLIVVGHGAAGLAAALSAAEQARRQCLSANILLLDKAEETEAGGNTRWSPSYMRMAAPDRVAPGFLDDVQAATGGLGDPLYFQTLADHAVLTIGWLRAHGVAFDTPTYYLSVGPPRIQPVGGGGAIVEKLSSAVRRAGVAVRYQCSATRLVANGGRVAGVEVQNADGTAETLDADAVILATGGFQGNPAMMRDRFGPRAETLKLISPGTRLDSGDGIRIAVELGAATSGDWNGMHIEPVDPRSGQSAAVVLVYPYGIVVDQDGKRFFDEGAGLVHETWERFARDIHFVRPDSTAFAILDSRLYDIDGFERAIRSELAPHRADTIEGLAELIGVPGGNLRETIDRYNAAIPADAAAVAKPPYLAYPLVGAIAYTFGGLATNARAEVLDSNGPMPGLYAAGETTGHFFRSAPNAVSVLRALVFGRIAGQQAVHFLQGQTLSETRRS